MKSSILYLLAILAFLLVRSGAAPTHELVSSFAIPPQSPGLGSLISTLDGYLWGTTKAGGAYNKGTIYKVKADGSDWQTVLSFTSNGTFNKGATPSAGVIYDGAGYLWGTTQAGGASGFGTIFKLNISTGELSTLVEFTNRLAGNKGAMASGKLVSDGAGNFWGTTTYGGVNGYGTVFKIDATSGVMSTVVEFSLDGANDTGAYPLGGLASDAAGLLWGTTSEGGASGYGTVFNIVPATGLLTTVLEFSHGGAINRGASASGELVLDANNLFWGTTMYGGAGGYGTVFKLNPSTGVLSTVIEFNDNGTTNRGKYPQAGLVSDGAGFFWGTTSEGGQYLFGTLFKINALTGVLTTIKHFGISSGGVSQSYPRAGLFNDGAGFLWGTTEQGGGAGLGTVYKVHAATGVLSVPVEFSINATTNKGRYPYAGLSRDASGVLWGTTASGGAKNQGTVFKLDPATGVLITVIDFTGSGPANKGTQPYANLVDDGAGSLWSTTFSGGLTNVGSPAYGTVYKVNTATGVLTTVFEFANSGTSGAYPRAGLAADGMGFLWGTTYSGGDDNGGTIFKINASSGVFTQVAKFATGRSAPNGSIPYAGFINDNAGSLWGTTTGGVGWGTIYKVNVVSGALSKVLQFSSNGATNKGSFCYSTLVSDGAGYFWGTTQKGGANDFGTVFKVNAATNNLTTIAEFTSNGSANRGALPTAGLLPDGAGFMWGTTSQGGLSNLGTVFRIQIATGQLTTLAEFTGTGSQAFSGSTPGYAPLFRHSNGHIYGTTMNGGPGGAGTIFRFLLGPTPATLAASSIASRSATLNGTLIPNGFSSVAGFEWGTDPALATSHFQSAGTTGNGSAAVPLSSVLTNLEPLTTYYFRIRGTNAENSTPQRGKILFFTTADPDADKDGLPDDWEIARFGNITGQSASDDFDKDGIVELLEWAFDLNPKAADADVIPTGRVVDGYLTTTLNKKAGVTYTVQTAGSLSPGAWSAASTTVLMDTPTVLSVRDNVPANSAEFARFMRVRVTVP